MPQSSWRPGEKSSPATTQVPEDSSAAVVGEALGFENISNNNSVSEPWEERTEGKQPQEQNGGEAGGMAVAVKIRKGGFFGLFRRQVGGADDVVHVPVGQTCVICMEPFKPNEVLEVLLCQHLYHERCINKWLGDHTSCCVCKADMEEMAKATEPPRRRRTRTRSETRSESLRSDSGYGSDQARSNLSSVSAPAAFAGRVPPDSSGSLRDDPASTVSVLSTTNIGSDRTSSLPGHERAVAAAIGYDGASRAPARGARSPSPTLRPANPRASMATPLVRNVRSHVVNRSPATSTDTSTGASSALNARPSGSRVQPPSLGLSVSTLWNVQSSGHSEEHNSNSSGITSSINGDVEDHCRSSENEASAGCLRSPSLMRSARSPSPARALNLSPRRQSLSPSAFHHRSHHRAPPRRPRGPSSRLSRFSARAMLQSPARPSDRPPSPHPESTRQVLPEVFPLAPAFSRSHAQQSPRREFPSAVATLSTPQRMRRNSRPPLSFFVENSLSSALSSQVMTPQWQRGSSSTPRRQLQLRSHTQPMLSKITPARRQWRSPERGTSAASTSACTSNGGEPGREKVWGEGKLTIDEEILFNKLGDDAFRGGVVCERKTLGESTPRAELPGEEREAKAASISRCVRNGDETRSMVWRQGALTIDEEHEASRGNELEESAAHQDVDVGEQELRDESLPTLTAKPAGDCYPMSDSLPPTGKLNGWANTHDDEDWLEDFDKTPTSEPGSHKTCSTQWSEMESHSSGMESQLSGASGNSYGVDESSAMSTRRRRPVAASPTSPRHSVPTIAEAKRAPSLSVTMSPGAGKDCEEPWNGRVDRSGAGTPGSLTPGAVTPGALRARSASAPMIWD